MVASQQWQLREATGGLPFRGRQRRYSSRIRSEGNGGPLNLT